jgi:hypothetical protein
MIGLDDAARRAKANFRGWSDRFARPGPTGEEPAFDNIAVSGALAEDLFADTVAEYDRRLAAMRPVVEVHDAVPRWRGVFPPGTRLAGRAWGGPRHARPGQPAAPVQPG